VAKTGRRVGHGPIGQVAENLVKRGIRGVSEGVSKAVSDFHEETAQGLKAAATKLKETDARTARSFTELEHTTRPIAPHPGSAPALVPFSQTLEKASLRESIHYGHLDHLDRPTGIHAALTREHVLTGTEASRKITPPGFEGGAAGHARGHLLGAQIGGSGTEKGNLVTIHQHPANSPEMLGYERQVRVALEAGQVVEYSSTPVYAGHELLARGITVKAAGSGGLDIFVTVLNRGR
jgi:hypothetical protein